MNPKWYPHQQSVFMFLDDLHYDYNCQEKLKDILFNHETNLTGVEI